MENTEQQGKSPYAFYGSGDARRQSEEQRAPMAQAPSSAELTTAKICPFTREVCLRDYCAWFVRNRVNEPHIGECALTVCARELRGLKYNLNP